MHSVKLQLQRPYPQVPVQLPFLKQMPEKWGSKPKSREIHGLSVLSLTYSQERNITKKRRALRNLALIQSV